MPDCRKAFTALAVFTITLVAWAPARAATIALSNTTPIFSLNPDFFSGQLVNSPSPISVSGVTDPVTNVTVTLRDIDQFEVQDLDIWLVGPTNRSVMLMSDIPALLLGCNPFPTGFPPPCTEPPATLVFSDQASGPPAAPPGSDRIISGTYKPFDNDAGSQINLFDPFDPTDTMLSAFNRIDPNGTWNLFVFDDTLGGGGFIHNGWTLELETTPEQTTPVPEPASLALASSGFAILYARRRRRLKVTEGAMLKAADQNHTDRLAR